MSVIVTGGAGFVGSHLVDALIARGEHVVVVDDLSTGRIANLDAALESSKATFVYADLTQKLAELPAVFEQAKVGTITAIYHLASPASPTAYDARPWETLAVNGTVTMGLIDLALRYRAKFLFASTSEVYGDPLVHPQPETYFGNVNPIGPRACYDEGKRFGEAAVSVAAERRGLDARIVRLFNAYGPRLALADGRLIPNACDAIGEGRPIPIHGTGQQTRSMTYIDDIIRGILLVADRSFAKLTPVNLGSEEEHTIEEIVRTLAEVAGVPFQSEYLPPRPEDPQRRRPMLVNARAIGWEPTTSLRDGLRETYSWYTGGRLAYV